MWIHTLLSVCSSVEGVLGCGQCLALVGKACFGGRRFLLLLGGSRATDVGVTLHEVFQLSCMVVTCPCPCQLCPRPQDLQMPTHTCGVCFGFSWAPVTAPRGCSVSILSVSSETSQTGSLDPVRMPTRLRVACAPRRRNRRRWFPSMPKAHVPERLPLGCFAKSLGLVVCTDLGFQVSVLGLRSWRSLTGRVTRPQPSALYPLPSGEPGLPLKMGSLGS